MTLKSFFEAIGSGCMKNHQFIDLMLTHLDPVNMD